MARVVLRHIIRILLNMNIGQQARVSWNGFFSDTFRVLNGFKQGGIGIISPVFFQIYFDVLLTRLREADIGCHLGHWFVAALAYADDIVILVPTANAARGMLDACDVFASEYCVQFNASKSKCIHFYTGKSSRSEQVNTEFQSVVIRLKTLTAANISDIS
jgi:Reverse transcriptase (RNA-dependent DNA polymerase)